MQAALVLTEDMLWGYTNVGQCLELCRFHVTTATLQCIHHANKHHIRQQQCQLWGYKFFRKGGLPLHQTVQAHQIRVAGSGGHGCIAA